MAKCMRFNFNFTFEETSRLGINNFILFPFQCSRKKAVERFNKEVADHPNMVAVIGCGCSSATEEVAMTRNSTLPLVSDSLFSVTMRQGFLPD